MTKCKVSVSLALTGVYCVDVGTSFYVCYRVLQVPVLPVAPGSRKRQHSLLAGFWKKSLDNYVVADRYSCGFGLGVW